MDSGIAQTRKEFWRKPQFTRGGMWWFTLFFGYLGLHHILLRSPQTALIFVLVNFLTLGYPWLYDLIQLSDKPTGGLGTEGLNQYGMGHPWGSLGLAQGMWLPDNYDAPKVQDPSDPPSPWYFLAYALLLPIGFGFISELVAGDNFNALCRFLYIIVPIIGWFVGIIAMCLDYFILIGKPANLVVFGTNRFLPLNLMKVPNNHSPNITCGVNIPTCDKDGIVMDTAKAAVGILGMVPGVGPTAVAAFTGAADAASESIGGVVHATEEAAEGVGRVMQTATQVAKLSTQIGGGQKTPLDYFAVGSILAVIVGGLLLTAGRSLKNEYPQGRDDSPPQRDDTLTNTRAIRSHL